MRLLSVSALALVCLLAGGLPACAQAPQISASPRDLGESVLRELAIRED